MAGRDLVLDEPLFFAQNKFGNKTFADLQKILLKFLLRKCDM